MFPDRVRRMVLDSTVDPAGVWYTDNLDQDYAFQGRMNAFFAWVARYDRAYQLGTTASQVRRAWYRVHARLGTHPIDGPSGPLIGPDEYDDTFLQGGYDDALWPGLAAALAAYYHSGSAGQLISLFNLYGAQGENEFAVYNAVECSDVNWPRDWAKWDRDTRRVYRTAPFEAWDNTWFNAACAFWPVKGAGSSAADHRGRAAAESSCCRARWTRPRRTRGRCRRTGGCRARASWSSRAAATTASRWPARRMPAWTAT